MKQKNSFSKLRAEKREIQNKLNSANAIICKQIDEIASLIKTNGRLEILVSRSKQQLQVEEKQKNRYKLRLITLRQLKDTIYNNYIKDIDLKNKSILKYKILSISLAFICATLIVLYFLK